jgi:hypothetical protein
MIPQASALALLDHLFQIAAAVHPVGHALHAVLRVMRRAAGVTRAGPQELHQKNR